MARFDRAIPPGGEGKITLEMKTEKYQGKVHKKARVFTNDPVSPQVVIGIKGEIWAPILLTPRYVNLAGIKGEKIEKVLHLKAQKSDPLTLKIESVTIPDKVTVELKEIEKGRRYDLTVRNMVKNEGKYRGKIKLISNYPERPEMTIRVSGYVRPPVSINPTLVNFGRISKQKANKLKEDGKLKRPVTLILYKGNNLKVTKVEFEKSLFAVSVKEMQKGRMVKLTVEPILEKLVKGRNKDKMIIYTNQEESKLFNLPVYLDLLVPQKRLTSGKKDTGADEH